MLTVSPQSLTAHRDCSLGFLQPLSINVSHTLFKTIRRPWLTVHLLSMYGRYRHTHRALFAGFSVWCAILERLMERSSTHKIKMREIMRRLLLEFLLLPLIQ